MIATKRVAAAVSTGEDESPNGSFDIVLSTDALDRDGEVVSPKSWKLPLPDRISINADHSAAVADIVGSGTPYLDASGNLRVKGTFASSDAAQHIRGLVADGHAQYVSVEFLRHKSANGEPLNELVGGAFVSVPSNPEARVLSAKAFDTALKSVLAGGGDQAMLDAIHNAAVHLGAACALVDGQDDSESMDGADGAEDGANKAAALALRIKALRR